MTLARTGFRKQSMQEVREKQAIKRAKKLATPTLKRTTMKKVGKVGKANTEARKIIAEICEEKGLNYCEIRFNKDVTCLGSWPLAPAHLHKRAWYKGNVELLADFNQWVVACQVCHDRIEHDKELTEKVFNKLRPQ